MKYRKRRAFATLCLTVFLGMGAGISEDVKASAEIETVNTAENSKIAENSKTAENGSVPAAAGDSKASKAGAGRKVAIDAGHQAKGSGKKEPIGPGAAKMKARVTGGTKGTTTGLYEYELNLIVAQKLRDELEERGYEVYMVRESSDVDLSNAERAQLAYDSGAELFVRIHANGSENSRANGAMTICPTPDNPYIPELYGASRRLSDAVLDALTASAGCKKERVWETDSMSGINWSLIPVTIVEMGYLTNPGEEAKLADEEYQQLIAQGIADGIDIWYEEEGKAAL